MAVSRPETFRREVPSVRDGEGWVKKTLFCAD